MHRSSTSALPRRLIAALLFGLSYGLAQPGLAQQADVNNSQSSVNDLGLQTTVKMAKSNLLVGEPLTLDYHFKNVASTPFSIAFPAAEQDWMEITVVDERGTQKRVPTDRYNAPTRFWQVTRDNYAKLTPGQQQRSNFRVIRSPFQKPGKYTVRVSAAVPVSDHGFEGIHEITRISRFGNLDWNRYPKKEQVFEFAVVVQEANSKATVELARSVRDEYLRQPSLKTAAILFSLPPRYAYQTWRTLFREPSFAGGVSPNSNAVVVLDGLYTTEAADLLMEMGVAGKESSKARGKRDDRCSGLDFLLGQYQKADTPPALKAYIETLWRNNLGEELSQYPIIGYAN